MTGPGAEGQRGETTHCVSSTKTYNILGAHVASLLAASDFILCSFAGKEAWRGCCHGAPFPTSRAALSFHWMAQVHDLALGTGGEQERRTGLLWVARLLSPRGGWAAVSSEARPERCTSKLPPIVSRTHFPGVVGLYFLLAVGRGSSVPGGHPQPYFSTAHPYVCLPFLEPGPPERPHGF